MSELMDKFTFKKVKVEEMKPWEFNPRIHSDKGLSDLSDSMEEFGMVGKIHLDKDLTVIGGHARLKVLVEKGVEEVECFVAKKKLSQADFKAVALLSNQVYSSFNQQKVNEGVDAFELIELGFDVAEVDFEEEEIEFDDDEAENTSQKAVKFVLSMKFNTEEQRDKFEKFLVALNVKYPDIPTNMERFIHYLKETL